MNNQAISERKHDFPFTGMEVNAITLAQLALVPIVSSVMWVGDKCVIKWEEKSEETSAEDSTEMGTTALSPLLI